MTKDDIIRLAQEAELNAHGLVIDRLARFATLVAAAEREACAKVCDSSIHDTYIGGYTGAIHSARRECAAAIRARKENANE